MDTSSILNHPFNVIILSMKSDNEEFTIELIKKYKCDNDVAYSIAIEAIVQGRLKVFQYIDSYACIEDYDEPVSVAAKYGRLDFLQYIESYNPSWPPNACYEAVLNKHDNVLNWLTERIDQQEYFQELICYGAAEIGRLDLLKKYYANTILINIFGIAIYNGHLECVKYLHENGAKGFRNWYFCPKVEENEKKNIIAYIHSHNVLNATECELCSKKKNVADYWEMDSSEYDCYVQWLPKEVVDDVISLI